MAAEARPAPHLTSQRELWWMLFPAAGIGLFTLAAWVSSGFGDNDAEWLVPGLSLGGITAGLLLLWAGIVTVDRAHERRKVRRVFDRALARWPQYATEAQWRQVIAKADRPAHRADVAWPAGILTVVVVTLAVLAAVQGVWDAVGGLVAFWLLATGLVVGRHWNHERERRADRRRREALVPYPACWLAAEAFYHEDWGLIALDRLSDIRVVGPDDVPRLRERLLNQARRAETDVDLEPLDRRLPRAGWSLLLFTLDERVVRTLFHQVQEWVRGDRAPYIMPVSVRCVRVPPGREREAAAVAAAVAERWLTTRPATW